MEKETLADRIEKKISHRKIASEFNVSQATIRYWLKKYGLQSQLNKKLVDNYGELFCKRCGNKEKNEFTLRQRHDGCVARICKVCARTRNMSWGRRSKQEAVDYKGGKCQICGYNKCLGALEFHHTDRGGKDPNWKNIRTWPLALKKAELDRCMLLCANCHDEIHYLGSDIFCGFTS